MAPPEAARFEIRPTCSSVSVPLLKTAPPLPLPAPPDLRFSSERERVTPWATVKSGPAGAPCRVISLSPSTSVSAVIAIDIVSGMVAICGPHRKLTLPPGGLRRASRSTLSVQEAGVPVPTTVVLAYAGDGMRNAETTAAVRKPAQEFESRHRFIGLSSLRSVNACHRHKRKRPRICDTGVSRWGASAREAFPLMGARKAANLAEIRA